jgi:hypothetical protein
VVRRTIRPGAVALHIADTDRTFPLTAINEISSDAAVTEDPADREPVPVLSIVISVYNELKTIGRI